MTKSDQSPVGLDGRPASEVRTPFFIGQPSDQVRLVANRTGRQALRPPEEIGTDTNGLIVQWFLPDVTLTFRLWKIGRVTCYRVTEIIPTEQERRAQASGRPRKRKRQRKKK